MRKVFADKMLIVLSKRVYILMAILLFLLGNFCVCKNIYLAGISGFLPLVDIKIINHFPIVFMGQVFNIVFGLAVIFFISEVFGTYIEKGMIILPLFHGFARKQIFRMSYINMFVTVFGLYLLCFVIFQVSGLPLEILYIKNKDLFEQYGAMVAPISMSNGIRVLGYLMFQYVAILPLIGICMLVNVMCRKRIIAGGISVVCYLLIVLFTMQFENLKGISFYYYQENFMNITVIGDEVLYSFLSNSKEYVLGIGMCVLCTTILIKIAEKKFIQTDF